MKFVAAILSALVLVAIAQPEQIPAGDRARPRLIPLEDFFRNPQQVACRLSPDGRHISFLAPWNNRLNVHVRPVDDTAVTRVTDATEQDIFYHFWANDSQIAFIQDKAGNENYHLYITGITGPGARDLTPFDSVRVGVVDDLEDIEDEMIIEMNRRDPRLFDVYRVNIQTGELTLLAENPGGISGWQTDHDGRLRIASTVRGTQTGFMHRRTEADSFEQVTEHDFRDDLDPHIFTFDNRDLYVLSNVGRDKLALYAFDLEKKALGELLYENPEVDVSHVMWSHKRRKLTGVAYYTDKLHYHFFDDWRANLQAELEARLPGIEVALTSVSRDESRVLARTYDDRTLGAYYYYEPGTGDFRKLVDVSPWLNRDEMAEMKPVSYQTRDGLTVHGYLTLPVGLEPRNLPVIMLIHGGPVARDYWGFDPEVQFLANRGYAVLQPNFRGSSGYGKGFVQKGFKQWGRRMQDDITDGVRWLIARGIADSTRIGIYGGSYGGYATLAGLAFTPDLYACGVDYVGPSNLLTFMNTIPPYWEQQRTLMYEVVGDPEKDRAELEQASPLFRVDSIRAPVFVAQGANDPRVKQAESDQMVAALQARGIPVQYMVKEDEGHGFANEENRFDFYRAMERFLAEHLGGRAESPE